MKKYTLIIVILFLAAAVSAETRWDIARLGYGVKAGAGTSNVEYHDLATGKRTAYCIGGLVNYEQSRILTLQMEALFAVKGYKLPGVDVLDENDVVVGQTDVEITVTYMELPVAAKLTAPFRGKFRPFLIGGGFMALAVGSRQRISSGLLAVDYGIENVETVDLGAIGGLGIDIKAGGGWLMLEARYDYSLMAAVKSEDQKSRVLFFQIGYQW